MRVIRHASLAPARWKNGGGSTTTIAVEPAHASLDDFDWRVSIATIDRDGPFSLFPGIDRSLALVEGAGLELDIAGRRVVLGEDPLSFEGELAVSATLRDGSTTDLNVMTRRSQFWHTLDRVHVSGTVEVTQGALAVVFVVGGARVSIEGGGEHVDLAPRDTAIVASACRLRAPDAQVLVATLTARHRGARDAIVRSRSVY